MKAFRKTGAVALSCALLLTGPVFAEMPVAGVPVPELALLDREMTAFMEEKGISAGSLSVMKDGKTVFHHVYGWQDREKLKPLRPDAIFRVASVTKPFTAAAIRKLIADGELSLDTPVFKLEGKGVLDLKPVGEPDARLKDITVDHLLKHRGGWDRQVAGDLTYAELKIAAALKVPSPPSREDTVRYIMGQPLQNDPGAKYAYSNIGYLLLGLIVEKVSGQDYRSFVQANVVGPAGFTEEDWILGRSFAKDADPREPYYDETRTGMNVFFPAASKVPLVELPYGSFDMEARTGQGRIVTNGRLILGYLNRYQVVGEKIGGPRPAPGKWSWNHNGAQKGTNADASQRGDGINFAILFNKRPRSGSFTQEIKRKLDKIFDDKVITTWPVADVSGRQADKPQTKIGGDPLMLSCSTEPGRH